MPRINPMLDVPEQAHLIVTGLERGMCTPDVTMVEPLAAAVRTLAETLDEYARLIASSIDSDAIAVRDVLLTAVSDSLSVDRDGWGWWQPVAYEVPLQYHQAHLLQLILNEGRDWGQDR